MMSIVKANAVDEDIVELVILHMQGIPVKWRDGGIVRAAMDDAFELYGATPAIALTPTTLPRLSL